MTDRRLRPRKQPGQQRAVETRQRLLEAAARVFSEHGYAAGTTHRIAEAAGHSIGSLYQYFPNKDAILAELVTAHARAGVAAIDRLLDGGTLPDRLEDRVRLFVRAAIDNHRDDPALHRMLFEEAPRPPELLEFLHAAEQRAIAAAEQLLGTDPRVTVPDVPMAARLVVTAVESLVHRFTADGGFDDAVRTPWPAIVASTTSGSQMSAPCIQRARLKARATCGRQDRSGSARQARCGPPTTGRGRAATGR